MRRALATLLTVLAIWSLLGLPVALAKPHHGGGHHVHPDGPAVSDMVW